MTKTINELLEEFNDPPFTRADYKREMDALLVLFKRHHDLDGPEQIEEAIRTHKLRCENKLVEWWIALAEADRHLD